MFIGKVAKFFRVSKLTIKRWADAGDLHCTVVNKNGTRYFTEEDLRDYLKKVNHSDK